jgi:hypothetical protein
VEIKNEDNFGEPHLGIQFELDLKRHSHCSTSKLSVLDVPHKTLFWLLGRVALRHNQSNRAQSRMEKETNPMKRVKTGQGSSVGHDLRQYLNAFPFIRFLSRKRYLIGHGE